MRQKQQKRKTVKAWQSSNQRRIKNLAIPQQPNPGLSVNNLFKWINFGNDNLFPNHIAEIGRNSSIHKGVLRSKTRYVSGNGIVCDEKETKLNDLINNINRNGDSLHNLHKLEQSDKFEFGNSFIEIVTGASGFISLYHHDATTVRLSKTKQHVILCPDWQQYPSGDKYKTSLPVYPKFEKIDGYMRSCYFVKEYAPEFRFYGIPSWIPGMNNAGIDYKSDKWNLSEFDNNMNMSGLLEVITSASEEQAKDLVDDIIDTYTGEGNNGGLFVTAKEPGATEETKFTQLSKTNDGSWIELKKQITDSIIIAHEWRRSLSGISDNTGFDTDRILNDYSDVLVNQIEPEQALWLEVYSTIITNITGLNCESLKFVNKQPVNPKKNNLTGSQIQGIIDVVTSYKQKEISNKSAIQILMSGFMMTEEEALNIIS